MWKKEKNKFSQEILWLLLSVLYYFVWKLENRSTGFFWTLLNIQDGPFAELVNGFQLHGTYFPVNFTKSYKNLILQNTFQLLLLKILAKKQLRFT